MTLSNTEQETIWINAWNEIHELVLRLPDSYILLPEFQEVTCEDAKSWIQDRAYESYKIKFSIDFYKGKKSIFINKVRV